MGSAAKAQIVTFGATITKWDKTRSWIRLCGLGKTWDKPQKSLLMSQQGRRRVRRKRDNQISSTSPGSPSFSQSFTLSKHKQLHSFMHACSADLITSKPSVTLFRLLSEKAGQVCELTGKMIPVRWSRDKRSDIFRVERAGLVCLKGFDLPRD